MAEEIRSLSVKELRLRLDQAGVDHSKCVEKSELVSLVLGIEADHEEKEDSAFSGGHLTTRTGGRSGRSKKNSEKHQKSAEKYKKKKSRKDDSESDSSDEEPSSTDESDSSEEERRRRKQKRKKKKKKKKKAKKKTNKARKRAQEEEDSTDAENHERRPGAAAEEARREGRRASLMGLMATASGSSSPHAGGGGGGGEEEEEDADGGAAESAGLLLQYLPYYGQGDPATDGAVASLLAALPPGGRALRSTVDAAGNTLLLLAAQYAACRALAPGLLAAGADPAARNAEGALALHFACAKETLAPRLARDLVEAGSPVDIAENTYGCTPLHYAAGAGDADLCAFLLAKGASAAVQDHYNYTPLDYAKQSASEECVMLFEDAGGRKGAAGAPVPVNKKASSIVMGGAGNGLMAGNMQKFDLFSDDEESVTTPTKPSSHSLANGRSSTFRFNNAASGGSPKRQLSPGGGGGGGGGGGPSLGGTAKGVSFRGGAAAQGPDALSPTKASMGATLGGPWRAHLDWESGRVYFLNEHDGGSVWEDDLVREARALDDPEHQPSAELKAFLKHHAQRARLLSFLARSEEPWRVAGADALLAEHGGDWGAALAAVAKELGPRGGAAAAEELAPLPANYLRSFRVRHPLVTSKKAFRRGGAARLGGGGGGGVDLGATLSLGGGGGNATLGRRRSSRGLPGGGGGAGLLPDDLLRSGMLPSEAKEGPSQYYGASPTPKLKSNSPAPPKDGSGLTLEVKVSGTLAGGGGGGAKGTTPGGGGGGGAGGAGAALPRRPSLRSFGPGDGIASPMGRTRTLSGHMGKTIRISKKGGGALLGGKLTGLELKLHEHFVAKELRALEARHRARRGAAEDAAAAARAERELAAAVQRAEADNLDAEIQRLRKQISELEGELKTKESGFREKEAKVLAEEEAQNGEIASLRRELAAHKEETKKLDAELDQYRDRDSEKIAAEQKEAQDYENELSSKMKFSQETIQKAKNDREGEFRALSQKLGKELREVGQLLEHEASELRGRLQAARAKGAEDASRAKSEAEAAQRRAAQARQQTETLEAQAKATREEIEAAESMRGRMSQLAALLNAQAELRKKLHNRIEDLKGKIRVYVRVRPLSKKELKNKCENVASKEGQHTIKVVDEKSGEKHWDFDQVFAGNPGPPDGNSQEAIFRDTKYLITSAVDGYNVCIFAYGQTGSGKTFTMFGPGGAGDGVSPTGEVDELAGLTPRCVVELFRILEERRAQYDYSLTVSMYELYRDGLRDLLNHRGKQRLNIKLAEHTGNGLVHVEGGAERPAADLPAVLEVIREGAAHRATSSTQMNADSSRSHLVCMLVIKSTNRRRGTEVLGKLTMVDLAGSERVGRSGATGDQLKEAQSINKSLSALGDVIGALTTGSKHVPYRNHPLTMLMSDSLGGNAKTLMFVCASPADYNAAETGNALNFAARCKDVTNAVAGGAGAQQAQIQALRRQLEKMGGGGKKGAAPAKLARPT